jgi:phosphate:Na+ symporter
MVLASKHGGNMSLDDLKMLFQFVGGLGLFLYGMNIMADGIQRSADGKLKKLMGFLTQNRFMGVIVGALITAIIQSSSATTVMVVGFVNAGVMSLVQAAGVIMGANIGTTITAWIVSMNEWTSLLKPSFFAPAILGVGAFMLLFSKVERRKKIGGILVGVGALFIGLSFMSDAIKPYRDADAFVNAFTVLGKNPILAILAGAVVTAIIQSSSASIGILQTLAIGGMVNWQSAVFITMGQNIGTCVTALISSIGTGKNAKRASIIHLLFNMFGAIFFGLVMFFVFRVNTVWANSQIDSIQISIFHTIFNVSNTIILFPFANKLVQLSKKIIRDDVDEVEESTDIVHQVDLHLDRRILANPAFAIESVKEQVLLMGNLALDNVKNSVNLFTTNEKLDTDEIYKTETIINQLETSLSDYLVEVDNESLTEHQHQMVKNLFYTISDFERISDHAENLAELADGRYQREVKFSDDAIKDMENITESVIRSLEVAIEAMEKQDSLLVVEVNRYENKVDKLETELREKHIERLSEGCCSTAAGIVFLDAISNLERISDHANNVAGYTLSN